MTIKSTGNRLLDHYLAGLAAQWEPLLSQQVLWGLLYGERAAYEAQAAAVVGVWVWLVARMP